MDLSQKGPFARPADGEAAEPRGCGGGAGGAASTPEWSERLRETVANAEVPIHLVGVGNQLRSDDAAGLEVVASLRSKLGPAPARGVKIHGWSPSPERLLAKLSDKPGRIVVFDAVEASREPGAVVFCGIADTRYGFFATHNVPLRLVPGIAAREKDVFLVGIQPESLEVGEGLSDCVKGSVERVVAAVTDGVEKRA